MAPDPLSDAHRKLMEQHAALEKEFEKLRGDRRNLPAHSQYLEKIRAHLDDLHKHTEALRLEGERLSEQRELLHASHIVEPHHPAPTPHPQRTRRAFKR